MAELFMTDAERKQPLTQWKDEDLGRALKCAMLKMKDKGSQQRQIMLQSAAAMMINESIGLEWQSSTTEVDIFNPKKNRSEVWTVICRKNVWPWEPIRRFLLLLFPFMK